MMTKEDNMNLEQFHEKFGIKRIDFSKVRKTGLETQYGSDNLICPYCEKTFEYDAEEIDDILGGESYQCPFCEKWFYAKGEASIDTWCTPMEEAVIEHQRHIQQTYDHIDDCLDHGLRFDDNRCGNVEWEVYAEYARPYFKNLEVSG